MAGHSSDMLHKTTSSGAEHCEALETGKKPFAKYPGAIGSACLHHHRAGAFEPSADWVCKHPFRMKPARAAPDVIARADLPAVLGPSPGQVVPGRSRA
jgi:hypothetical protein